MQVSSSGISMKEIFKGDFSKFDNQSTEEQDDGFFGKISKSLGFDKVGKQKPALFSGVFSNDARYFAYTYYITHVTNYSRRGGSTFSSGYSKYYLQIVDLKTGEKIIKHPKRHSGSLSVNHIENNNVWLKLFHSADNYSVPCMYSISNNSYTFDDDDLLNLNAGTFSDENNSNIHFFENKTGKPGAVIEGIDGRQYLVDPITGKATLINSNNSDNAFWNNVMWQKSTSVNDFEFRGNTRKIVLTKRRGKEPVQSERDFIEPEFLTLDATSPIADDKLTICDNGFFVYSQKTTNSKMSKLLSMLDYQTLKERWTIEIPIDENANAPFFDKELFAINGNILYVANKSNLIAIDASNGKIIINTKL